MDPFRDGSGTPAWRPASVLFISRPPTPISSNIPSAKSTSLHIADNDTSSMDSVAGREIEPFETTVCDHLIQQIVGSSKSAGAHNEQFGTTSAQLSRVLQEASKTIQYHAKWFAPGPLSTLLQTALEVASRSSSTNDLHRALDLIETIATYSHLPTLLSPVRFIAWSYYQGSRSNRHRKLNQRAWAIAQHILESHLGGQFAGTLLEVISDPEQLRSKMKFGAAVGALMLADQKLLPSARQQAPTMQPTQLLLGIENAAVDENLILREQVAVVLSTMLTDNGIFHKIDIDGSLDTCLDIIRRCVRHSLDATLTDTLLSGIELRFSRFEPRHQPVIARMFLESQRPLPAEISSQLLVPWRGSLLVDEQALWDGDYRHLLDRLCKSSYYVHELAEFVELAVSAFFRMHNIVFRRDFVNTLETLITDLTTQHAVRGVLARGIVAIFTHNMQKPKWEGERNWLFPLLCRLSIDCIDITTTLMRIRADASGEGYLEIPRDSKHYGEARISFPNIHGISSLALESWVNTTHDIIVNGGVEWDVYDALLTSLAPQIRNHALWCSRPQHINTLRQAICERLNSDSFVEPPSETGLTKSYVVSQFIQILTAVTSYHNHLPRNDIKAAILTFINVAGSRDQTVSIHCIHALTICCYELPEVMAGYMDIIISKMSKMVTQRQLAIYVLEFLAGLSRLPLLQEKLRPAGLKRIFGVCHSYLQTIRGNVSLERKHTPSSERSGGTGSTSNDDMAQYVYALAHHVITFWYMALKRSDRRELKDFITSCLKYTDADGREHTEEQGLVTIDLMDRVDAEEDITAPTEDVFDRTDGRVIIKHRLSGLLLLTTETALRTSKTILTIRRPSGTAQRTIVSPKRGHYHDPRLMPEPFVAAVTVENDNEDFISVFPEDTLGRTYGKVFIPRPSSALGSMSTITLPEDDDSVRRAIESFDRTSALDSHKAGVIYIGEGQQTEDEILLNQSGSPDYRSFLDDLGTLRALQGATFNAQGLDRSDNADGEHTIVWNNEVTELVYHITTFMPNDPIDDHMTVVNKKRHIGNDFVNIIFNNSGAAFRFDTFPSAFNYVYIVISPSERTSFLQARTITIKKEKKERFYNVHVLTRPGYPNLSSASQIKVISGSSLGGYIRNLTLNACVFSAMWSADDVGEYPSSWRRRLHMLKRLADQHRPKPS